MASPQTLPVVRRRRTQYLVAKGFQIRFSLFLTVVGLFITAIIGFILYGMLIKTQSLLIGTGITTSPQVIDYLSEQRSTYLYSLFGIFVCVTLVLMIFGIFVSHRLAGPIFAISRKMNDLCHGNFNATLELRSADEFQELKEVYNTLVHALQNQVKSELIKVQSVIENLNTIIKQLSSEIVQRDLRAALRELQAYYNYKKNLIEPSASTSTYRPLEPTEDELLK
ncbi:MAG: HAMP domain-containing protein [Deltaproteobacteria bacterium]